MEVKASYWLLVTRENGHLEMYSVPDLLLSYLVAGVGMGHRVLSDSLGAVPTLAQAQSSSVYDASMFQSALMVSLDYQDFTLPPSFRHDLISVLKVGGF